MNFRTVSSFLLVSVVAFPAAVPKVQQAFLNSALRFSEARPGAWRAGGPGFDVGVTPGGAVVRSGKAAVALRFVGAAASPVTGLGAAGSTASYYIGGDQKKWRSGLPAHERIVQKNAYRSIDVEWYGIQRQLEYDIVVHPGADPSAAAIRFEGATSALSAEGGLVVKGTGVDWTWRPPVAWQETEGGRRAVEVAWSRRGDGTWGFRTGTYDRSRVLRIDPVMEVATLMGGRLQDYVRGSAVDAEGNVVFVGVTGSSDFPLLLPFGGGLAGSTDWMVVKLNSAGRVLWSSVVGGTAPEEAQSVAVDSAGNAYIVGNAVSSDFPRTIGAAHGGTGFEDGAVVKLTPGGRLVWSQLIGGSSGDGLSSVAVSPDGFIWAVGYTNSDNFPLVRPLRSTRVFTDAVVIRLDAAGAVSFSTLEGGNSSDYFDGIAIAPSGEVWTAGYTYSSDLAAGGLQKSYGNSGDCILARYNTSGTARTYLSYLGGTELDRCQSIRTDPSGRVYVAGQTSSPAFPTTAGTFQATPGGGTDAFVARISADGSALEYSTYLGGRRTDYAEELAVDSTGHVYVVGVTHGAFPIHRAVMPTFSGHADAIIASQDNGLTWTAADNGIGGDDVREIAYDPGDPNILYAAGDALYRSTDKGLTWQGAPVGLTLSLEVRLTRVLAATFAGIYQSTTHGASWSRLTTGSFWAVASDPEDPSRMIAVTPFSVHRSTDGGTTWTALANLGTTSTLRHVYWAPGAVLVSTSDGIRRSTDGGNTWTASANFGSLRIKPGDGDTLYSVSGSGVRRSTDLGITWSFVTNPLGGYTPAMAVAPGNPNLILGGAQVDGMFRTTDGGSTWSTTGPPLAGYLDILFHPSGGVFATLDGKSDGFIAKLDPQGKSLVYSTYWGGGWYDNLYTVSLASNGVWVGGGDYEYGPRNSEGVYRTGRSYEAAILKLVDSDPPTCTYSVVNHGLTIASGGGVENGSLLTSSNCTWTASSNVSWLRFSTPTSGTGSAVFHYVAEPNPGADRVAELTVAGEKLTVLQRGSGCSVSFSPSSISLPARGGAAQVQVLSACRWALANDAEWIGLRGTTGGTGNSTVTVSVVPNLGSARTGYVWTASGGLTVNQEGAACPVIVARTDESVPAAGGSGSVPVIAVGATCAWTAVSDSAWLRISAGSGTGSGSLGWTAGANPGPTGRIGTVAVNNVAVRIFQPPPQAVAGCTFISAPALATAGSGRQVGTLTVTASAPTCAWTARASASWIEVYPLSGTGGGTISYTVYPNQTPRERRGAIFLPGQAIPVLQAGSLSGPDERFVTLMYFNFLGRLPSDAEVRFHAGNLKTIQTRTGMVTNYFNSAEFNISGRFVAGLYAGLLARDPEFGGWLFQRNALAQNLVTQDQLVENFINGAEFAAKFGPLTEAAFVRLIYRNILLREATDAEVTWRLSLGMTRVALARDLLNSTEFRDGKGPRMNAFLLYAGVLLRDATPAELTTRGSEITSGGTAAIQAIIDALANGAEMTALVE